MNIPCNHLMYLYRYAALGRLVNGLLHNLNGPLHNLGMDIEMMQLSIAGSNEPGTQEIGNIKKRLERMSVEFEHIAQMIRTTSMRLNPDENIDFSNGLTEFLEQELDFLNANLYFKHHVQTHLELEKLPPIATLPKGLMISLSWFFQAIVEELEKRKIDFLEIEAGTSPSSIKLDITTKGRPLSDRFMDDLESDLSLEPLDQEENDIGIRLAVGMMRSAGVDISGKNSADQSMICLTIPITNS